MKKIRNLNQLKMLFFFLGSIIIFFILFPLIKIVMTTNPKILWETLNDHVVNQSILLTMYAGLISTLLAFIFGIPLAYCLARYDFKGKEIIEGIIDLPVVIPHTAAGIALLMAFHRNSIVGKIFASLGIEFIGNLSGIIIAMSFVSLPFLINAAKEGFQAVDVKLEKAARTLGANGFYAFSTVSLPLAKRSIISGMMMMWARGISEFGAVLIIAYHPMVAPVLLFERFQSYGLSYAQPVGVILIFISLLIFIILRILLGKRNI
ncbi:ABC transporter permease [bacterium]|nr:ABC transporter permease [bacterium]MBU1153811.1 ABC transporter permease [bacterium]